MVVKINLFREFSELNFVYSFSQIIALPTIFDQKNKEKLIPISPNYLFLFVKKSL